MVLCAQAVGNGLELDIERINHKLDEKNKQAVMGQSAWRAALNMLRMVLGSSGQYLAVAGKVSDKCKTGLNRWELSFQRAASLDGLTLLGAAPTAVTKPE